MGQNRLLNRLKELVEERADFAKLSNNERATMAEQPQAENKHGRTGGADESDLLLVLSQSSRLSGAM